MSKTRTTRWCWLFFALTLGTPSAPATEPERPNLVLVLLDDLGPEWVSCYGGELAKTPHIDRLANEGMRFENAWSMPKCTPTRVTLLTGQYPFRHGWVNHWDVPRWGASCHFDPKHDVTFARPLREAGYRTAIAGKWQINDFRVQPDVLAEHGFEEWCVWTGFETGNPRSANRYADPYVHRHDRGSETIGGAFGPDVFTTFLIDFARRRSAEPFLLFYPMVLTHGPLVATPLEPDATGRDERFPAMVRYADHLIGRLVRALDDLDVQRPTVIVVTSDNGSPGGIRGRRRGRTVDGGKGKLLETGCSVPFVVRARGLVPPGVTTAALTDSTDLFPTFLELAGVAVPAGRVLDGRSLAAVFDGTDVRGPRRWILSMGGGEARRTEEGVRPAVDHADRVLRQERFKLWIEGGAPTRLFDLLADPTESQNRIASPDPVVRAALEELLAVHRTFPEKDAWPRYDPTSPQPWDRK